MRFNTLPIPIFIIVLCTSFTGLNRAPAGTSDVPGLHNIYLDKTEITNIAWREFVYDIKEKHGAQSEQYKAVQPDTAIWKEAYNAEFGGPGRYDNYPVVGVSYQQALAYCSWRSKRVSEKERRKITYSLPDLKLYKMTRSKEDGNKVAEGLYSTNLGFRTFLGLCDNAAEMTDKEGVAVRGSDREICLETYEYHSGSPTLGFRCKAELK